MPSVCQESLAVQKWTQHAGPDDQAEAETDFVEGEEESRYRPPHAWRCSAELWVLCRVENFSVLALSGPVHLPEETDAEEGKRVSALKVFSLKQYPKSYPRLQLLRGELQWSCQGK